MLLLVPPDSVNIYIRKRNLDQIFLILKSYKMNKNKSNHQNTLYESILNILTVTCFKMLIIYHPFTDPKPTHAYIRNPKNILNICYIKSNRACSFLWLDHLSANTGIYTKNLYDITNAF